MGGGTSKAGGEGKGAGSSKKNQQTNNPTQSGGGGKHATAAPVAAGVATPSTSSASPAAVGKPGHRPRAPSPVPQRSQACVIDADAAMMAAAAAARCSQSSPPGTPSAVAAARARAAATRAPSAQSSLRRSDRARAQRRERLSVSFRDAAGGGVPGLSQEDSTASAAVPQSPRATAGDADPLEERTPPPRAPGEDIAAQLAAVLRAAGSCDAAASTSPLPPPPPDAAPMSVYGVLADVRDPAHWDEVRAAFQKGHTGLHGGDVNVALNKELSAAELVMCVDILRRVGVEVEGGGVERAVGVFRSVLGSPRGTPRGSAKSGTSTGSRTHTSNSDSLQQHIIHEWRRRAHIPGWFYHPDAAADVKRRLEEWATGGTFSIASSFDIASTLSDSDVPSQGFTNKTSQSYVASGSSETFFLIDSSGDEDDGDDSDGDEKNGVDAAEAARRGGAPGDPDAASTPTHDSDDATVAFQSPRGSPRSAHEDVRAGAQCGVSDQRDGDEHRVDPAPVRGQATATDVAPPMHAGEAENEMHPQRDIVQEHTAVAGGVPRSDDAQGGAAPGAVSPVDVAAGGEGRGVSYESTGSDSYDDGSDVPTREAAVPPRGSVAAQNLTPPSRAGADPNAAVAALDRPIVDVENPDPRLTHTAATGPPGGAVEQVPLAPCDDHRTQETTTTDATLAPVAGVCIHEDGDDAPRGSAADADANAGSISRDSTREFAPWAGDGVRGGTDDADTAGDGAADTAASGGGDGDGAPPQQASDAAVADTTASATTAAPANASVIKRTVSFTGVPDGAGREARVPYFKRSASSRRRSLERLREAAAAELKETPPRAPTAAPAAGGDDASDVEGEQQQREEPPLTDAGAVASTIDVVTSTDPGRASNPRWEQEGCTPHVDGPGTSARAPLPVTAVEPGRQDTVVRGAADGGDASASAAAATACVGVPAAPAKKPRFASSVEELSRMYEAGARAAPAVGGTAVVVEGAVHAGGSSGVAHETADAAPHTTTATPAPAPSSATAKEPRLALSAQEPSRMYEAGPRAMDGDGTPPRAGATASTPDQAAAEEVHGPPTPACPARIPPSPAKKSRFALTAEELSRMYDNGSLAGTTTPASTAAGASPAVSAVPVTVLDALAVASGGSMSPMALPAGPAPPTPPGAARSRSPRVPDELARAGGSGPGTPRAGGASLASPPLSAGAFPRSPGRATPRSNLASPGGAARRVPSSGKRRLSGVAAAVARTAADRARARQDAKAAADKRKRDIADARERALAAGNRVLAAKYMYYTSERDDQARRDRHALPVALTKRLFRELAATELSRSLRQVAAERRMLLALAQRCVQRLGLLPRGVDADQLVLCIEGLDDQLAGLARAEASINDEHKVNVELAALSTDEKTLLRHHDMHTTPGDASEDLVIARLRLAQAAAASAASARGEGGAGQKARPQPEYARKLKLSLVRLYEFGIPLEGMPQPDPVDGDADSSSPAGYFYSWDLVLGSSDDVAAAVNAVLARVAARWSGRVSGAVVCIANVVAAAAATARCTRRAAQQYAAVHPPQRQATAVAAVALARASPAPPGPAVSMPGTRWVWTTPPPVVIRYTTLLAALAAAQAVIRAAARTAHRRHRRAHAMSFSQRLSRTHSAATFATDTESEPPMNSDAGGTAAYGVGDCDTSSSTTTVEITLGATWRRDDTDGAVPHNGTASPASVKVLDMSNAVRRKRRVCHMSPSVPNSYQVRRTAGWWTAWQPPAVAAPEALAAARSKERALRKQLKRWQKELREGRGGLLYTTTR